MFTNSMIFQLRDLSQQETFHSLDKMCRLKQRRKETYLTRVLALISAV